MSPAAGVTPSNVGAPDRDATFAVATACAEASIGTRRLYRDVGTSATSPKLIALNSAAALSWSRIRAA
jgi:hypothetical protein